MRYRIVLKKIPHLNSALGKGKLNISGGTTITGSSPHNHLPTPADNSVHLGRQQIKRKAEQTKKLVCNLVGDLSREAKSKLLVDEASLKRSVQEASVVRRQPSPPSRPR